MDEGREVGIVYTELRAQISAPSLIRVSESRC